MEKLVSTATAFMTGEPGSLVVVIPVDARRRTGSKRGTRFAVKVDGRNRLIYEPLDPLEKGKDEVD